MTSVAREALIATAWRLFATVGYTGTSVEAIARELGTSKRTIYEHFRDKEQLLEAGAELALRGADAEARRIIAETALPRERFRRLIEWLTRGAQHSHSPAMADIRRGAPAVAERIEQQRRAMIRTHLSLALEPATEGVAAATADRERVAEVIAAAVAGIMARGEAAQDLLATAGDIERFLQITMNGLFGPEDKD
ncbi:MAG: TetR/AcrR family transcriptional regulator [Spirochaetales bacterium]